MPAAVLVNLLPLDPALAVTRLLEGALRCLVLHERTSFDLVEVELAETKGRAKGHRLRGDALAPQRLVADDDSGLAVAVPPVDAPDAGHPDHLSIDLDHPLHGVRILAHAFEPFLFLRVRHRADARREADDLGILEPPLNNREVFLARRTEDAFLAADHRTEHGRRRLPRRLAASRANAQAPRPGLAAGRNLPRARWAGRG